MSERILILSIDINLHATHSLKAKRRIRLRIVERMKARYNVSVAETRHHDEWQTLGLTVAYVAIDESTARNTMHTLRDMLDVWLEGEGDVHRFEHDIV